MNNLHILFRFPAMVSFLLLFSLLNGPEYAFAQSPSPSSPNKPIKELLNPDGSLILSSGFSGSVNLEGYRIFTGQNGEPRFVSLAQSRTRTTATTASDPDDEYWDDRFSFHPLNLAVNEICVSGSDVYVGGSFTDAGGNADADYVARWNGTSWNVLGTGLNSYVTAIAVSGSDVYVGGSFTDAGGNANADRIARWDGASWNALGTGLNNYVSAIAVSGSDVYVGGPFTDAGGNANADYVARWDGTSWNALGTGLNNYVLAIAVSDSNVYVGGAFTDAGGNPNADYVARWDGSSWNDLGGGLNMSVTAITVSDSNVYVGGFFTDAGGNSSADHFARWDGASWNYSGSFNNAVYAIAVSGSNVYVGGIFTGSVLNRIVRMNGWNSYPLGTGLNSQVSAIAISGSDIYVGGSFTDAGGTNFYADYLARWDGASWNAVLGMGLGAVHGIAVSGSDVYVGGNFGDAGGNPNADRVARWDGVGWNALGTGLNSTVSAVAVSGSDIYVGGTFTDAGANPNADRIARWDGASWNALGTGLNNQVHVIAVSGSDVYVGGRFTDAGGNTNADRIARWDGVSWNALETGVDTTVYAIAVSGSDVYVGGYFINAGANPNADRIARWDGGSWNALGTGLNNYVFAIAVSGSDVYVGGGFTDAGGNPNADRIARWDGVNWNALGTGLNNGVGGIAVSGSDVYVGGGFTDAGGNPNADRIARWDGASWNTLGTGLNSSSQISVSGSDVYVGGSFTVAGGKGSSGFGRWFKPTSAAAVTKTFSTPTTGISFHDSVNVTAVRMDVSSSSGGGTILINRYEDVPQNVSGITGNVSQYRWIIQQMGLAPSFSADVGFRVSQIPNCGITDPTTVVVYSRPTPGSGSFTALTTSYDETFDRIYANGVSDFGEFAFGSLYNPLPVQIVGLSAVAAKASVGLRWSTATEVNNHGFEVEQRSVDATTSASPVGPAQQRKEAAAHGSRFTIHDSPQWFTVGFVKGSGTSTSPKDYSFTDEDLASGRYAYRIKQINLDGSFAYTIALEVAIGVPLEFSLSQNYPNPFNPTTTIEFDLPRAINVDLIVYDNLGRKVKTLVEGVQPAGYHKAVFDAQGLSSGMYYYRIAAGDFVKVKKLILLR